MPLWVCWIQCFKNCQHLSIEVQQVILLSVWVMRWFLLSLCLVLDEHSTHLIASWSAFQGHDPNHPKRKWTYLEVLTFLNDFHLIHVKFSHIQYQSSHWAKLFATVQQQLEVLSIEVHFSLHFLTLSILSSNLILFLKECLFDLWRLLLAFLCTHLRIQDLGEVASIGLIH